MESILIKLSGELFNQNDSQSCEKFFNCELIHDIVSQIKELHTKYNVGLVIGGGNFFRGAVECRSLKIKQSVADYVGMIATVMNGLLLQEFMQDSGLQSVVLSAIDMPQICLPLSQKNIDTALVDRKCIVFAGGSGNPFFTTDTNAVVRALQIGATQLWKATKVDFIYDSDPTINKSSNALQHVSYQEALDKKLKVMDATAFTLAQENALTLRVFNIFEKNALLRVAKEPNFGSTVR